jgi:hypothetical protein
MKVQAKVLKAGDKIIIGKKHAIVTSNKVVPVEIIRTVETSVLSYRLVGEDEDDEAVHRDRHFNGCDKIEYIKPKKDWWKFFAGTWNEIKSTPSKKIDKSVPFFIKS